jgi:hypothetical protein
MKRKFPPLGQEEQRESSPAGGAPPGEVRALDRERSGDRPFARGAGPGRIHAAGTGGRRFSREAGAQEAEPPLRVTSWRHGQKLSLDRDTCLRILRESGHQTACVSLDRIPDGLTATELAGILREQGASL